MISSFLSDSYCTRLPAKGQLALGGLRSAEPRFGEPGRAPPAGVEPSRHRGPRWLARRPLGQRPHAVERHGRGLGRLRRPGDRGLHGPLQSVHPRVRVGPPVVEVALDERAEEGAHGRAREQERARRHQEPDRVLDGIDVVDEPLVGDEVEYLPVVVERRPGRERHPGRAERHAGGPPGPSWAYSWGEGRPARLGTGNGSFARYGPARVPAWLTPRTGPASPPAWARASSASGASASPPITESAPCASR